MLEKSDEFLPADDVGYVQVSFFSEEEKLRNISTAVFDVPLSATYENLNALVNKTISTLQDDWIEKRFELLIGETFVRSSLAEFIEEHDVDTERVLKIECILGKEAPHAVQDIAAPDWVSSIEISSGQ
ncbi:NLE domain protein [Necator americanus]|uniref:NLE domain protein n=1 Tax=Necator americanus TaxID=51031 RepID=W2TJT7_NECAM|nr:NLE domain protein [Necator americanus]ETN81889.1 NLE domain protein [Necator americanus]